MDKKKVTVPSLKEMKQTGEKIVSLTAYDYLLASILDEAGVDVILVGDSGAMVFAGHETTLPITMDEMIYHVKAVSRGTKRALLVADMPFLSFQITPEETINNAGRFLKEGHAEAVKVEGGQVMAESIRKLVQAGIPVMGHLGLTPQSIHQFGGYKVRGSNSIDAQKILEDAVVLEQAGAFSIVLEKVPAELARNVTEKVSVPTIGIGAGKYCDGQVLVTHDMLGLFEKFRPKFVRRYAELGTEIRKACERFAHDVREGKFPNADESY
ncbi:MAG: 3-methyl-2-oxobutanoate hydroxymethyltransferase [bacterium]